MADFVEPVVGITAKADSHRELIVDALNADNWIPTGYTPTDGGGLTLDVAAGEAFLAGALAKRDVSTPLTMADATTNHVWVYISDTLDDGVVYFEVNTTGTPPAAGPSAKIAEVPTTGGGISSIDDLRQLRPVINSGLDSKSLLTVERAAAANGAYEGIVQGDSVGRFYLRVDGSMEWGDGASTRDTTLYRAAASRLKTDDDFEAEDLRSITGQVHTDASELAIRNLADSAYKDLHVDDLVVEGLVDGVDVADHDARHEPGGADPMAVDAAAATGSLRTLGLGAAQAAQGSVFSNHDARHEPGGADPMAVDAAVGVGSLRTLGDGALQAAPGDHSPSPLGVASGNSSSISLGFPVAVDDVWLFITIRGRSASAEAFLYINDVIVNSYASAYSVDFATPTTYTNIGSWRLSGSTNSPEFFIVHIHKQLGVGEDGVGSWTGTRHGTSDATAPNIINGGGMMDDVATAGLVGVDVGVLSGTADIVIEAWGGVQ